MTIAAGKTPYHSYFPGSAMSPEAIPFEYLDDADINVSVVDGAALTEGVDYQLGGDGRTGTGTITALVDAGSDEWQLWSETPTQQQIELAESRKVPLVQYERELDRAAIRARENAFDIGRAPKVARGQAAPSLDALAGNAGKVLMVADDTPGQERLAYAENDPAAAEAAALRSEYAAELAADDREATAADVVTTNGNASSTSADRSATEALRDEVEGLSDLLAIEGRIYPTTAAALGNGIVGHTSLTGGSGGTAGEFAWTATGGTEVVPARGTFLVEGGAVTAITVTDRGYYSVAPTGFDFSASSGLTGASASPTVAANRTLGDFFYIRSGGGDDFIDEYEVTSGPAATATGKRLPNYTALTAPANDVALLGKLLTSPDTASEIFGETSDPADLTVTGAVGGAAIVSYNTATTEAMRTAAVRINADAAGVVPVFTHSRSGDDMTALAVALVSCEVGINHFVLDRDDFALFSPASEPMPAGCYFGFSGEGVVGTAAGSSAMNYWSGGSQSAPDYTDASAAGSTQFCIQFTATPARSQSAVMRGAIAETIPIGARLAGGASTFTGPGTQVNQNWRIPASLDFPNGGYFDTADLYMAEAGTPTAYAYLESPAGTFTPVASKALTGLTLGLNNGVSVGLAVPPGGRVGIFPDGVASQTGQWAGGLYFGSTETFDAAHSTAGSKALVTFNCVRFASGSVARLRGILGLSESSESESIAPASARPTRVRSELLAGTAYAYLGFLGQSNIVGSPSADDATQVTTRAEYGAKAFNCDSNRSTIVAAIPTNVTDDADGREYPGFGAASYIRERMMGEGGPSNIGGTGPIVTGHAANGGKPITDMVDGGTYANHAEGQLTAAAAAAGSVDFVHLGQCFWQGEQDGTLATARATYKAALVGLAQDYDTNSKVIAPGDYARNTYVCQVTSIIGTEGDDGWEIAMAQFEACRDEPLLSLAFPAYVLAYEDSLHASPTGSRRAGAYFGRAAVSGRKFEPLQVVDSYADGSDIVLVYNRDDIELDTSGVALQTNYGFRAYNASDVEVTSLDISVSGNEVRIGVGATPTGYSWSYGNITSAGIPNYTGGAGNLRDNAGDTDVFEGWPLHNWAVCQEGDL